MGAVNTNFVVKSEANTTITNLTNSQIFDNGTNVGIGTSSPQTTLDILSEPRTGTGPSTPGAIYATSTIDDSANGIEFRHTNQTQGIGFGFNTIYATGTNTNQDIGLRARGNGNVRFFNGDGTERMRITSDGNVGIGTTAPTALLSFGNSVVDNKIYVYDATNDKYGFGIRNDSFLIYSGAQGASTGGILLGKFDGTTFTEAMRIRNDGNVGIGTTAPQTPFQAIGLHLGNTSVAGSVLTIQNTPTTRGSIYFSDATSGVGRFSGYVDYDHNNDHMEFGTNGTEKMRITSAGNVGIGTTDPSGFRLNVNGTIFSAGSSVEYKENINNYKTDTEKLMSLRPVTYVYKEDYSHLGKPLVSNNQIGLIAEEVADVFPELAITKNENGKEIVRNVDYEKLSVVLLCELQKLRTELNELKKSTGGINGN